MLFLGCTLPWPLPWNLVPFGSTPFAAKCTICRQFMAHLLCNCKIVCLHLFQILSAANTEVNTMRLWGNCDLCSQLKDACWPNRRPRINVEQGMAKGLEGGRGGLVGGENKCIFVCQRTKCFQSICTRNLLVLPKLSYLVKVREIRIGCRDAIAGAGSGGSLP